MRMTGSHDGNGELSDGDFAGETLEVDEPRELEAGITHVISLENGGTKGMMVSALLIRY